MFWCDIIHNVRVLLLQIQPFCDLKNICKSQLYYRLKFQNIILQWQHNYLDDFFRGHSCILHFAWKKKILFQIYRLLFTICSSYGRLPQWTCSPCMGAYKFVTKNIYVIKRVWHVSVFIWRNIGQVLFVVGLQSEACKVAKKWMRPIFFAN